ncbi:hypothetical protein [Tahibacter soli]|jgi:hypothetical protein|uniref:Uncharacterized protein n=1 Tax=Tahibacter soli TaxID=2983605 RepID=A0A9X4BJA0_9GAMM|nr:hypothetical protein [Tahibacter soli]MDC8016125.1 hypothetical protein [Tahibacter soli]
MGIATVTNVALDSSKLHAAAVALKSEKDILGSLEADAKTFLARFGVSVDDATAKAIQQRVSTRGDAAPAPASVVHIDV